MRRARRAWLGACGAPRFRAAPGCRSDAQAGIGSPVCTATSGRRSVEGSVGARARVSTRERVRVSIAERARIATFSHRRSTLREAGHSGRDVAHSARHA
jgi:hypothetical protein